MEEKELMKKPPIGVKPRFIFEEEMKRRRIVDLTAAVRRYLDEQFPIPIEWISEYNEQVMPKEAKPFLLKKIEYEVNDVFRVGLLKVICIEGQNCCDCIFHSHSAGLGLSECEKVVGKCCSNSEKKVIFVKAE